MAELTLAARVVGMRHATANHQQGEAVIPRAAAAREVLDLPLAVATHGRRFHVEWYPHAAGPTRFLQPVSATAGNFRDWVQACPLTFTSNKGLLVPGLLGTSTLAILAGQNRYAHVTALRSDRPLALPEEIRLVRLEAMHGETILLCVDGDCTLPQLRRRAKDADGDLGAVGREDFFEGTNDAGPGIHG